MGSGSEREAADVSGLGDPRPLDAGDLPRAVAAIVDAFAWHEPWGEWAFPERSTRSVKMTGLVSDDLAGRFLEHGECWTIGGACVTLWIPPPDHPGGPAFASRRDPETLAVYGEQAEAMAAGDRLIAELKPSADHWYLDTIATEPALMRHGLGARLLDHNLALRDAAGDRCALDTHTPENVSFYRRRGFEITGEGRLPGGPPVFMMVREPR